MIYLTEQDVRAACDEAHDARGYTEANALAAILERMILAKQREQSEPVAYRVKVGDLYVYADAFSAADAEPLYLHPAPVPEGMALVPREPTLAMLTALFGEWNPTQQAPTRFAAMIAAAEKEGNSK